MTRNVSQCRSCKAPVVWALTTNGKRMPVDALPVDDGDFLIDGDTVVKISPFTEIPLGADRFTSHFVTCPDRDLWRQPRARERAGD